MIKIEFRTGNAAFEGDGGPYEAAQIIHQIATNVAHGKYSPDNMKDEGVIKDSNGNTIGQWSAEFTATEGDEE